MLFDKNIKNAFSCHHVVIMPGVVTSWTAAAESFARKRRGAPETPATTRGVSWHHGGMVTHGMVESMIVWAKVIKGNVLQGRLASPSHHTSPFAHEAALKQSRAAQACSSKHVQKGPRVERSMMILVWCLMIQGFIYTHTGNLDEKYSQCAGLEIRMFLSTRWVLHLMAICRDQPSKTGESSNLRYFPCRWTEFAKSFLNDVAEIWPWPHGSKERHKIPL